MKWSLVCVEWNESAGEGGIDGGIDETRGVPDSSGVLAFSDSAISGV